MKNKFLLPTLLFLLISCGSNPSFVVTTSSSTINNTTTTSLSVGKESTSSVTSTNSTANTLSSVNTTLPPVLKEVDIDVNKEQFKFDQNLKYFIYFSTKSPTKIKDNCHHNRSFPTLPSVQTQSCLTLCDPMDHSLLGSSVHGILQARILEWVAMPFSRGSSQPKDWTWGSCTAGRFFTV